MCALGMMSRRRAIQALGARSALASAMAPLMIERALADTVPMGPGGIPLARPGHPVTLPLHEQPIKSGMQPETGGTFKLFNYQDYFDKKLIDEFGKKYNVKMELTTFDSMDQAITRLASKSVQPDVTDITPDRSGPGRRRQADQADQSRLHPKFEGQHLALAAQPVL